MILTTKKFNKEIYRLRHIAEESSLHPLVKEKVKSNIFHAIANNSPISSEKISTETNSFAKRYTWQERKFSYMSYLISVLLGASLIGGTAAAANTAKPGDTLFPVRQAEERIALTFAGSADARAELEAKFAERRLNDLAEMEAESHSNMDSSASTNDSDDNSGDSGRNRGENREKARTEISNAIDRLTEVRAELEAKGNTNAAASIGNTISRMQARTESSSSGSGSVNSGHGSNHDSTDDDANDDNGNNRHGGDRNFEADVNTDVRLETRVESDNSGSGSSNSGSGSLDSRVEIK